MIDEDILFAKKIIENYTNAKDYSTVKLMGFLDQYHISLAKSILKKNNINDYVLDGGFNESERKVLFLNCSNISRDEYFDVLRLESEKSNEYNHRTYLGSIIKCNLDRNLIGDINVNENGADIITLKDNFNILNESLPKLERYKDFRFSKIDINDFKYTLSKIESVKIIIPSYRIDNFISDLTHTSRSKSLTYIHSERVFLNGQLVQKPSKEVKLNDVITIRGKGRFIFKEDLGLSRSKRHIVLVDQYV